ncbi:hypothetical protein GH5_06266 [Leishmania sp. Ghana 2012 LV757]|uniref:hypothetical protein n=1 Tax=Leishmania sp. Ghana 2012 LV757 TaxID=2803181 RepID=UPI001B55B44B|nr:hypothetical protein GH5_06266 [Leishmania sp. Ghana 2012 LV757]
MSQESQRSLSPPAVTTDAECLEGVSVDRVPKVRRDVIASRLAIHGADLRGTSPASSLSPSSMLSSISSDAEGDENPHDTQQVGSTAARTVPLRMPLSSVAKVEVALQKKVHLSRGGLCAEFTVEDIRHIEDGDVLRYLSAHTRSSPEGEGDIKTAPVERPRVPVTTVADIEAHMAALQKEINTFITVVDNEGHAYEIRVGASGHVQVPIDDDDHDDGGYLREGGGETELVLAGDSSDAAAPEEEAARTEGSTAATVSPSCSEATRTTDHPTSRPVPRPSPPNPARQARAAVHLNPRARQQTCLSSSAPPTQPLPSRQLPTARPPVIAVPPPARMTDSEATRVKCLLDPSAVAASMSSPYLLDAEMEQRLRVLEAETRRYAAVREGRVNEDALKHVEDTMSGVSARTAVPDGVGTARDLGNAYMYDAREHDRRRHQLRSVNERLRALQRRAEVLALAPTDGVPSSIAALRPSWAQTAAPVVEEAQIQLLLELAREEETRAKEAGVQHALPPAPAEPFSGLRRLLSDTCAHAADLLATYESTPLVRRSPPAAVGADATYSDPDA